VRGKGGEREGKGKGKGEIYPLSAFLRFLSEEGGAAVFIFTLPDLTNN
jgi:hypothetical protein